MENENQEQEKLPVVEKQKFIAQDVPFKVLSEEPRDCWKTNYAYYIKQKTEGKSVRPLIGRFTGEGQFQVYNNGEWQNANLWQDYSIPKKDEAGNVQTDSQGRPKRELLFDHKFDWIVEFDQPVPVEYYDKDLGQVVTKTESKFYVRLSKNMSEKLKEELNDPRTPKGSKFIVTYDPSKSPAEQYKIKFHSAPEQQ